MTDLATMADTTSSTGQWVVHKFGGTSVGSALMMKECINIVRPLTKTNRVAMVVSAMGGKPKTTDLLLETVHAAAAVNTEEIKEKMNFIRVKHQACISEILSDAPEEGERIVAMIEKDLNDIMDLLRAVQLMRTAHDQILELVSGYGEIWSASIFAAALKQMGLPFKFVNAREVLLVNEATKVYWEESSVKLDRFLAASEADFADVHALNGHAGHDVQLPHLIITGYIASMLNGTATTLKRDGSDYSASIFGRLLKATSITIWTDVSGVYSADPRRVPKAQILPDVSYKEAIELAYFGAKVIHPKTMEPAIAAGIPIYIRNTFKPEHPGTRIYNANKSNPNAKMREKTVCGFTTIDNIALVNIEGTGMIGVPGVAHRVFGALHAANVPVMFIAQASSEHNICFAINDSYAQRARDSIEEAFYYELKNGSLSKITVIEECTIVAAVGESMSNMSGVSGLFFKALGDAAVNVLSISQGCDERNIAAVVRTESATRALRAVHAAFWLSSLDVSIGIVGTGRVGSALLLNLLNQVELLGNRLGLNIKIRGVCNSRKMWLGENLNDQLMELMSYFSPNTNTGMQRKRADSAKDSKTSFNEIQECMCGSGEDRLDTNLEKFLDHIRSGPTPHTIIIDTSSSHDVARMHPLFLRSRTHVVTANKRAIANSLELYNAVFEEVRASHQSYMSEVTIGASLPIRTTLSDILCSGDAINAIVGIMSVSVNMILTAVFEEGVTFTEALRRTYGQGLFEENAFADLEGIDAAEKVLIMGREIGIPMHMSDIQVEPLAKFREIPDWSNIEGFFTAEDEYIAARVAKARANNCTVRYVQRIECDPPAELGGRYGAISVKATVRLEEVPMDSILAMARGAVYNFCFHTDRYSQSPLIVQGPLSDPANTASGIVGDILRISRSLGAKDRGPEHLADITNPTTSNQKRLSGNELLGT